MAKEIRLANGKVAIVDDEDYEWLSCYKWHGATYAQRREPHKRHKGARAATCILMHREIMGITTGDTRTVDHVNGNPLDNRRANLRFATRQQQMQNKAKSRKSRSHYKGITRHNSPSGHWLAMITLPDGSRESIGSFKTERDAAIAYDVFARRYHGQFARLNFPDEIHTQLPLSAVSNASTLRRGRRFKGVYRRRHRFTALLVVPPKKRIYLGTFSSEEEAARAYDTAAKLHLRANCFLNFPNESQSKE